MLAGEKPIPRFRPRHSSAGSLSWILQRVTAALLVVFLFIHLFFVHGLDNSASPSSVNAIQTRIATIAFYVIFDLLLVATLAFHALNGVRAILYDTITNDRLRSVVTWVFMLVGLGMIFVGFLVLVMNGAF